MSETKDLIKRLRDDGQARALVALCREAADSLESMSDALRRADRALMNLGMGEDAQARREIAVALATATPAN